MLLCHVSAHHVHTISLTLRLLLEQLLILGIIGQWIVKPLLGMLLASTVVPALGLPTEVATGLILVGSPGVPSAVHTDMKSQPCTA